MTSHELVLQHLGCNDLKDMIDQEFLEEFGLSMPGQYGMVCEDLPAHIKILESLGAGPFLHATSKMPNWQEYGQAKEVYAELALGYSAGQEIELLGAGKNTRFYADKIPDDGGIALHHACIFQTGIFELEQQLNKAGYTTVGAGHIGLPGIYTTRIRYLDTRDKLGMYLELVEYKCLGKHLPPGERVISGIAKLQKRFSKSG